MNFDIEQLKHDMMTMLQDNQDFAASIGRTARAAADYMLEEEDNELNPKQRDNYAIFFCIGASWAIANKVTEQSISQNNE